MSMFMGEPSAEQRADWERLLMRGEAFMLQLQRFITEVDYDDLELLHAIFGHVSSSPEPRSVANWYEGMMSGAMAVRKVKGESPRDNPESLTS